MYRPNFLRTSYHQSNGTPSNGTTHFTGGSFHAQSQRVLRDSAIDKVKNTNRAMDPKMLEFKQFCTSVYGNQGYLTQIVTEEKAFAFLFYHAYREKKRKKKRLSCSDSEVQRFDRADYDKIMTSANFNLDIDPNTEDESIGDVLGWDMVNHYRCAIKRVLRHQRDNNANTLRNEDLDSERITRLLENVGKRKDRVAKANFKERMDGEFTPYKMISEVNLIEGYMWNHN